MRTQGNPDVQARLETGRKPAVRATRGRANTGHVEVPADPEAGHADAAAGPDAGPDAGHAKDLAHPTSKPDTPKVPPAMTPDISELKPTKCHGELTHRTTAPNPKQTPMPHAAHAEPEEGEDANAETQSHFSQASCQWKRKARPSKNKVCSRGKQSSSGSSAGTGAPKPKATKRIFPPHEVGDTNELMIALSGDSTDHPSVTLPHRAQEGVWRLFKQGKEIGENAKRNELCNHTLELFVDVYGRDAGNAMMK
ncbi:hypothetical protein PF011_g12028 [Phytophthora fragariae]|uniref:Uncharacterized protein n=1 Tax=Phytophthora fragariae TaxID=53985 RepID=A0A6A3KD82_9STRA|nr:hypothetical protein PF011_g12028 [Phytophthora fragariae]